jgi:hypothetical protein
VHVCKLDPNKDFLVGKAKEIVIHLAVIFMKVDVKLGLE